MRTFLVLATLAAMMLVAGCQASGAVGVGDKPADTKQPAQQNIVKSDMAD